MADLALETPEGIALRFELAGPGTRILSAALDGLLFVLGFLVGLVVVGLTGFELGALLLVSGAVLLLVAYFFGFSWWLDGRTPGKLWTGIRVCDTQGFAPRVGQLLLRSLFVPLEAMLLLPVPLVWILIAATPRRQRLGDLVAVTCVLRERAGPPAEEPAPNLSWSALDEHEFPLDPAAVRALSGQDLGLLRALLARRDLDLAARQGLYRRAAQQFHARLGLGTRAFEYDEARRFVRELFLLLREVRATTPRAGGAAVPGAPRASGSPLR